MYGGFGWYRPRWQYQPGTTHDPSPPIVLETASGGATAYSLSGANGSYTYTGGASGFTVGRLFSGSYGAYTYTGQSADFSSDKLLSGSHGVFTKTGLSAALTVARELVGDTGSYAVSGQDASFTVGRNLSGSHGVFAIIGFDAVFSYAAFANDEKELGGGGGGGNWKKREKRRKFILPNGDVVWATKSEVEYNIELWKELNPELSVKGNKVSGGKRSLAFVNQDNVNVDFVEFDEMPKIKPLKVVRLAGIDFNQSHPSYETVLRALKSRQEDDEFIMLILESL